MAAQLRICQVPITMFGGPTAHFPRYPSNLSAGWMRRESGSIARTHDTSPLILQYVIFNCDSIAFTYLLDIIMRMRKLDAWVNNTYLLFVTFFAFAHWSCISNNTRSLLYCWFLPNGNTMMHNAWLTMVPTRIEQKWNFKWFWKWSAMCCCM